MRAKFARWGRSRASGLSPPLNRGPDAVYGTPEPNNHCTMKTLLFTAVAAAVAGTFGLTAPSAHRNVPTNHAPGCVFKTVYEGEGLDSAFVMKTPVEVLASEDRAYAWLVQAQNNDGGFAAGSRARQDVMDPHAVPSDPATTAMVGMALLRAGSTPDEGRFAKVLARTTDFLLKAVETAPRSALNITPLTGTQIQAKLGANIDVALAAQYLSNLMGRVSANDPRQRRWMDALNACTAMIQRAQTDNGSTQGSGWAGVLQSSFAANALESAEHAGAQVDTVALAKARAFQKSNFDANTGSVATDAAAGITLYAVSGSTRSSAKEARQAQEAVDRAKREGRLRNDAQVNLAALQEAGMDHHEAERLNTAYQVYNAAKVRAQASEVISGFGNNGGEEFLSFLQTGESLIINKDAGWRQWYGATTARLVNIQNNDGSWQGHHCITSPVFCTATALLILSVNNDIEALVAQGAATGG